jgi:hypothetical protein
MDSRNKQIPLPKAWQSFEDLCLSLFKAIWRDPLAEKNGRQGQPQHGVDVFGSKNGTRSKYEGVQCKGKDVGLGAAVSERELIDEIAKAEKFSPALQHWTLATTAPVDAVLQERAREISVGRERQGKFTVTVLGWGGIESLLCDHPEVLRSHYPELGYDIALLLQQFQQAVDSTPRLSAAPVEPKGRADSWRRIEFHQSRDIGPALLGRALGPSDALACPRMPEADQVVHQLATAYSARLVGVSGSGKSVCAYQVAHGFAQSGWSVFALKASDATHRAVPTPPDGKVLLLIDDAHLAADEALLAAEDQAGSRLLVLSIHNAVEGALSQRRSVRIDPVAGIQAIAAGLLANRNATLAAVRRADSRVGDLMLETALEERVAQAARYASVPWQFCFVLGGGWRRANEAVGTARVLKLDLLLAAIAVRQLASRDASPSRDQIAAILSVAGVASQSLSTDLQRLANERLVISIDDLRCPHQRFAAVLLGKLLDNQDETGTTAVAAMVRTVLGDEALPLSGLSTLLHELRFADYGRWKSLVDEDALKPALARCWLASAPADVMSAGFVLSEAIAYLDDWETAVLSGNATKLADWIANAEDPAGHGLARLLNTILNKKECRAIALTRSVSPAAIAKLISSVTPASVWHIAELTKTLRLWHGDAWASEVISNLDSCKLLAFARSWPYEEPIYRIICFLEALAPPAQTLALDLVEAFLPVARQKLAADPVRQFRYLDNLASRVLHVLDPLGAYRGHLAPTERQLKLARKLLDGIDLADLAAKLSLASLRDFQQVSFIIAFASRASPAKAKKLMHLMDWDAIGATIGDHWRHLPHDAEVLLGQAAWSTEVRKRLVVLIRNRLDRLDTMPARLALIAPELALDFVRQGGSIALARFAHTEWRYAPVVIALFAQENPELLPKVLDQCISTMAGNLSQHDGSWYRESAPMLEAMMEHSPDSLQLVLDQVDVGGARVGWAAAWASGGGSRKTVKILLKAAKSRTDALAEFARQFRPRRVIKG